jgi:signal transduction histidine kinase
MIVRADSWDRTCATMRDQHASELTAATLRHVVATATALRDSLALAEVVAASLSATATAQAKSDSDAAASLMVTVLAQAKADSEMESSRNELAAANAANATLEIALLRAEKQTIESNSRELRALMGNVAHDLKTPLQAISMGIEVFRYVCVVVLVECKSTSAAMCVVSCNSLTRQYSMRDGA